ncbi:MAG TPA: hypothetical protein VIU29_10480, partial [Candidatus Deferrimicrobiaceae bacterium]
MSDESIFRLNAAGVPAPKGLYDPANEHDACGVGFVARIDAEPRHDIVTQAVQVLINLEHRGALGGDKATGDGAGVMLRVPHAFFEKECAKSGLTLPSPGGYAVGMIFLPPDPALSLRCEAALTRIAASGKCPVIGWRTVPVDPATLGELAGSTRPLIRQCFLRNPGLDTAGFERRLYMVRRLVEKEVAGWDDADFSQFYLTSLSARTIVYKGLLTGSQLAVFYPDLAD